MRNLALLAGTALALPLLLAAPARAQSPVGYAYPEVTFGGSLDVEMDLDVLGRRGSRRAYADLYTKTELGLYLNLPSDFTINGVFKLEPADRDATGGGRAFQDHAAWIDQLYLTWAPGPVELYAGKIHPHFGFAWDRAPGLYGADFAEGYELSEKIGVGAALTWSDLAGLTSAFGEHEIRAEMFKADTTVLSSSLFAARWSDGSAFRHRNLRRYGGADNTSGYTNYTLTAEGKGVPMPVGTLDYNLGYSYRQAGQDSVSAGTGADERGYVGGLAWEISLPGRIVATPLVEWARQENADGIRDLRRDVVTAGVELVRKPFTLAYAYGWQREAQTGADTLDYSQHSASIGYDFADIAPWLAGFEGAVGWRRLREDGRSANDFGLQIVYGIKF